MCWPQISTTYVRQIDCSVTNTRSLYIVDTFHTSMSLYFSLALFIFFVRLPRNRLPFRFIDHYGSKELPNAFLAWYINRSVAHSLLHSRFCSVCASLQRWKLKHLTVQHGTFLCLAFDVNSIRRRFLNFLSGKRSRVLSF